MNYDALLVVSFGGPEKPEDVLPFLENVLRGKNVPRERMLEVAEHYYHFGGKSPINDQNRQLIAALQAELAQNGPHLPIYWGNRNWNPLLTDTLRQMRADGVRSALAYVTSAFSSYSGCRQYLEDIARARQTLVEIGAPPPPEIDKLRVFWNHPDFLACVTDRVRAALEQVPAGENGARRNAAHLIFTAHSIPMSMASGCEYEMQLKMAAGIVANALGHPDWRLVYQSRSGPPTQPWLEPDILDYLKQVKAEGKHQDVVVMPLGFISDHMEVLFDLDTQAQELAHEIGLNMVRAGTVGVHPRFIHMIRDLIVERLEDRSPRLAIGAEGTRTLCAEVCCTPPPPRPAGRPGATA